MEVGHVNGHEENGDPDNLFWSCRACNVASGITLWRAGLGRSTRQFNPSSAGAQSLGQWVIAVSVMRGDSREMDLEDAIKIIHATPPERRSEYAREIWRIRKERYGPRGHSGRGYGGEVPF